MWKKKTPGCGLQSLLGCVWKQNLHWGQGLSPQLASAMASCKQDTVPETGLAVTPSTTRKTRLLSVPRKNECSRLWLPLLPGQKFPNSSASRVQTAIGFPWVTWKLFTAATDSRSLYGQWTNYSNAPNSEALSGSLLHFCKLLHPLLKYSLFLTICSAYCSHSICSRHIRPSQLLYNYPAATLKLQQVFLTHHVPEGNNPTLIQSLANSNNSKTCT